MRTRIAGVDEAGRGPLAGPVVAAAVILNSDNPPIALKDSKTLKPRQRELLCEWIADNAHVGVGIVEHDEIDRINILKASLLAMKKAVLSLNPPPEKLLIDGLFTLDMPIKQEAIVKGDQKIKAISAASIVAKVTRDRIMEEHHLKYPRYGFNRHKGYPTAAHRKVIMETGPCPIHRKSFNGVKQVYIPYGKA